MWKYCCPLTASRPDVGRISGLKPDISGPGLWSFAALVYLRHHAADPVTPPGDSPAAAAAAAAVVDAAAVLSGL